MQNCCGMHVHLHLPFCLNFSGLSCVLIQLFWEKIRLFCLHLHGSLVCIYRDTAFFVVSLNHTHTHSLSLSFAHTQAKTHSMANTKLVSLSRTFSLSLSLSLSLSISLSLSLSPAHTHTQTPTHAHNHILSLSLRQRHIRWQRQSWASSFCATRSICVFAPTPSPPSRLVYV